MDKQRHTGLSERESQLREALNKTDELLGNITKERPASTMVHTDRLSRSEDQWEERTESRAVQQAEAEGNRKVLTEDWEKEIDQEKEQISLEDHHQQVISRWRKPGNETWLKTQESFPQKGSSKSQRKKKIKGVTINQQAAVEIGHEYDMWKKGMFVPEEDDLW